MAATIAYMTEWGWDVQDLQHWTRAETTYMLASEVHLQEPWWKLEHLFTQEAKQQRTNRFAQRPHHQQLTGLDWHTYRQLRPKLPAQQKRHLQTWVQGALHYKEGASTKPCPLCHVPATAEHVLWLCKWHRDKQHKPLPPEWLDARPLEPQDHLRNHHPYQGHGIWHDLQPIGPDQYAGLAYTLDATPSHYDTRSQIWVFGLCLRSQSMGQLKMAPGPQTKGRALFAGLVALAKHTTTPAKVIVQLSTVWEAWQQAPHRRPYPDLLTDRPQTHHSPLHQPQYQDT